MKGTKILTLVVALVIVMNLLTFASVYAADVIHSTMWWNVEEAEISVLSMDVKIAADAAPNRYALHITASGQNNLAGKQNAGMLALRNGCVSFKTDGGWINNGQELAAGTVSADLNLDEWNNIVLKHKRTTGEMEIYLNNAYVGMYTLATPCTLPVNAVSLIADSTITTGCEFKTVYAKSAKDGVLGVEAKNIDMDSKSFTVEFSENIADTDSLDNVVIKNTNVMNGENVVALTAEIVDNTTVNYTWTEELKPATEYAIILPEDLAGISGAVASDHLYFATDKYISSNVKKSDYEEYNNKVDVTVLQTSKTEGDVTVTVNPVVVETETSNGTALNVDLYKSNNASNNWINWTQPTGEITSVTFDIMPLYGDLQMAIEFSNATIGSTPVYIAFSQTGKLVSGYKWPNAAWFSTNAMNGNWSQDGSCGEYAANKWTRFKVVFNDTTDTAVLYINGREAKTFKGNIKDVANIFGGIRFRGMNETRAVGTPVLLLDNVKTETLSLNASVNQVRFVDREGAEVAPFGKIDKQLGSIKLGLNTAYEKAELDKAVELYYNESSIGFTGGYDEEANIYTITPNAGTFVPSNAKIKVVVTDAADTNGDKASGTYYVTADEFDSYFNINICDSNGEATNTLKSGLTYYVNISAASYNILDDAAQIIVAQYSEDTLLSVVPVGINVGGGVSINKDSENAISFVANANADKIKVFAWKNLTNFTPWTVCVDATVIE